MVRWSQMTNQFFSTQNQKKKKKKEWSQTNEPSKILN